MSEDQINICVNNRIAKEKDFQSLVLQMLILRRLVVEDNDISKKYHACYSQPKAENISQDKYITQVEKCLASHSKQFNTSNERVQQTFQNMKSAEERYSSRKINCYNLVGESELENCQEVERRNHLLKLKQIYETLPAFNPPA